MSLANLFPYEFEEARAVFERHEVFRQVFALVGETVEPEVKRELADQAVAVEFGKSAIELIANKIEKAKAIALKNLLLLDEEQANEF